MKTIQTTATDKENLVGRLPAYIAKEQLEKPISVSKDDEFKREKAAPVASTSSQTIPASNLISEEDLTSDTKVSNVYWEVLAEKRRLALEETLEENQYLHEKCEKLESELNQSKQLLEESRELVNVLTEMLQEKENEQVEHQNHESEAEEELADEISETDEEDDEHEETPKKVRISNEPESKE